MRTHVVISATHLVIPATHLGIPATHVVIPVTHLVIPAKAGTHLLPTAPMTDSTVKSQDLSFPRKREPICCRADWKLPSCLETDKMGPRFRGDDEVLRG